MPAEIAVVQETATCSSCVEYRGADSLNRPGWRQLRGWLVPKPGRHFVDVRVWRGNRVFAAVYGFPRPDLAARFPFTKAPLLVGFQVDVCLNAGPNPIRFDALDISGEWLAVLTVDLLATAGTHEPASSLPLEPLQWHEFTRALESLLRWQGLPVTVALEKLAAETASAIAFRRQLFSPPAGFHAHWDEPAALTPAVHGRIALGGFLFHESGPLRRVLATADLLLWQSVETGRARPDVLQHYPQFPHAARSGAFALIDVPAQLPSPLTLRIYAELADGSLHLCGAQRTRVITPADARRPYPARGPVDFDQTRLELESAFRKANLAWTECPELADALKRLASDFSENATAPGLATEVLLPSWSVATAHPVPRLITLCTHTLNLEGAPLILLELARALVAAGAQLTLLSPTEGALRSRFEMIGVKVVVLTLEPLLHAASAAAARSIFASLGASSEFAHADLVVANTLSTFWGVHAAKVARKPTLFYVHESVSPAEFYRGRLPAGVIALATEAFSLADCVSFTANATRVVHLNYGRPANYRLTPCSIDVAALDLWMRDHPRSETRKQLGVRDDELLVSNVGTVSDRKGQHLFVRAVELLWRAHPALAARTRFLMLGGRDTIFDRRLADLVSHSGRANFSVVPETPDNLPYFQAADLFVCSSYEESSPRVVLEAMAIGPPIVSSEVNGVPEQVRHGSEAELVPPGDSAALAQAIAKLLLSPEIGRDYSTRARARVVAEFNAADLLPRHVALAGAVAARQD